MSTVGQINNGESGLSARTKLNLVIDRTTVFDTAANFTSNNPTLNTGQLGVETDDLLTVPKFKIGDGANDWNTLPYFDTITTPSLQGVTDIGSTTTNNISSNGGVTALDALSNAVADMNDSGLFIYDSTLGNVLLEADRITDTVKVLGNAVEVQSNKQDSLAADGTGAKYPTVDAVNAEFEKGLKILHSDFTVSSTLTGTTSITLINSALIPANSVSVGDLIEIMARAQRDTTTGTATNYVYINTSNTLAGATLVGTQSSASGYFSILRNLFVRSASDTETLLSTASSSNDISATIVTSISSLNIDWTVNQYIIQAFANAAVGNNTTSRGLIVNRFRK